jgi:hypothetical protein
MLTGKKVRLVLWRTGSDGEGSVIVVRGTVTDESQTILRIEGRLYQQVLEGSGETVERPIGPGNKMLLIPVATVRYGETIEPGTPEEELDRKVRLLKPLVGGEIRKIGGLT